MGQLHPTGKPKMMTREMDNSKESGCTANEKVRESADDLH